MSLTPDQKRAAEAVGSVAVTAGAGTGKTSMLAARYLHHVRTDSLSPLSIVAVTFTDKAADELRSRIRKTLIKELGDERIIAEVEAAQISTMHALAARVCRDFYDLAGIPADFTVLDDTEKPLWVAEKFEEAVSQIDPAIVEKLGFTWLTSVLEVLLKDPYSSEQALALGAAGWRDAIDEARETSIIDLTASDAWSEAEMAARECRGKPGDKLEMVRADVLPLLAGEPDIERLQVALKSFAKNKGAAANWAADELSRLRECLAGLKEAVKNAYEWATLAYGPDDEEAARRIGPLAAAFRQVRDFIAAEKLREKVLDFSDLEHYALKILNQPQAIHHYNLRWHAFLVDEFQDTNPIQADIVDRLTRTAKLTIVGDEKQAIYGFRGADIGVFSRVREQIVRQRAGLEVPLSLTFRTHHELVLTMNAIFGPVLGHLHQPLEAFRLEAPFPAPHLHSAVVESAPGVAKAQLQIVEARYIAGRIAALHANGTAYRDIAILARTWAPLDVYLDVLTASGIPAVHAGGGSLLETREALDVYALLCFLIEPNDDIPLVGLLRSPFFAVSDKVLFEASGGLRKGVSWWRNIAEMPAFEHAVTVLNKLIAARSSHSASEMIRLADDLTGYGAVIANMPHGERRSADLRGLSELFRKLERRGRGDIFGTTRYIRELIQTETEIPRPPLDAGEAVSLMTIHKSKGLEWPVVFVPDLARVRHSDTSQIIVDAAIGVGFKMEGDAYDKAEPAIFKLIKSRKQVRESDEARRLLYVAVTRARDKVFLTATKDSGSDLTVLRPGLDAANVIDEIIPYDAGLAIAPAPGELPPFPPPSIVNIEPVTIGLRELPVTALTTYARCPLAFKFHYVDGHPGIGEGFASAMAIGSLTHIALELGIDTFVALRKEAIESPDEHLHEAVRLANRFRSEPAYAEVRAAECQNEVMFMQEIGEMKLTGIADLVGPDFVLDYKTDGQMHPDEHRFQLWAYAEAFAKPRALIAYLRKDALHAWNAAELAAIRIEAHGLIGRIQSGSYDPTPSVKNCSYCSFKSICDAKITEA